MVQLKSDGDTREKKLSCIKYLIKRLGVDGEPGLIKEIAANTYMFSIEEINAELDECLNGILASPSSENDFTVYPGRSLPARWSTKSDNYEGFNTKEYSFTRSGGHKQTVDFKGDGHISPLKYIHKNKDESVVKFPVVIDKDGNKTIRDMINEKYGLNVSQGANLNNVEDFTIVHLWGNAFHPLYFAFKWNILVMPACYSFLTDKSRNGFPKKLKNSLMNYIWDKCGKNIEDLFKKCNVELPQNDFGTSCEEIEIKTFSQVPNSK